jgi:23S rRNA (guanosine2251-2'-O)-methyltransferase
MSDNKKYSGSKVTKGFRASKEDKSSVAPRGSRTGEKGVKESRGFKERKEDKNGPGFRKDRTSEHGAKDNKEDKKRINTKKTREGQENGVENKKFIRPKSEVNTRNNNASEQIENKILREDLIEGRNAVIEALKSDRTIEYILIAKGDLVGSISVVIALAKEKGIVIKEADRRKLDEMSQTESHQGVIAIVTPYKYFGLDDIFKYAEEKGEKPFIIILDEIQDPHNFGSIIRTAEVCGAHGIVIPKRKNVGATPTVYKTSAGAIEHMKIAKVTNINATIEEIKERGVWVYGADMEGENYIFDTDLTGAVAIVIGSEGRGISKLTKEKCDVLVKIPMVGKITSLNASVASGIIMYEIMKQKIR